MSQNLSERDKVVVVMGPTGSGKSTFIDCATRQDGNTIGHKLRSFTKDIRTVRIEHPKIGSVVFVDTPGFDDTFKSDLEILTTIANWLVKVYKGNVPLAAIIYMHKISDNRMTGSLLKNLTMFTSVCGQSAMPRVVIATTMWGKVDADEGAQREGELKGDFWKDILAAGCRTERFDKSYESAWTIIGIVADGDSAPAPLLSREIVDADLRLNETKAGVTLNRELEKLIKDRKVAARKISQQAKSNNNDVVIQQLNEQTAQIEERINQITDQLHEMKIPLWRRFRKMFRGNLQ
jgi:energy-coupling factor transporter ATP-binding protein EcfA2